MLVTEEMAPEEFKNIWTKIENNLSAIPPSRLIGLGLSKSTIDFLVTAGLPIDAAPFLSFCQNSDDKFNGISKLTEQYGFLESQFESFVVIGNCSNGDPIAVDTKNNDQIVMLDYENYFSPSFFNSSIYSLAGCLIAYRDFVLTVLKANGEDAIINSDFTNEQFEKLRSSLAIADEKALSEEGFWKEQLETELAMRNHNK